jgi:transcriptional regulator with XRE-family HTH domain
LLDVTAFGALVRQKRGQKRLTQETLAIDVFGESTRKGDISRIENGRVTPQEATVQKLCAALEISDAEMAPIRQSRPSARQLDEIPALSRDELQILASRFRHPAPYDADDPELREYLTGKAEEYRAYRATIDALDDRVAAIANLKGAAQDAAAKLDFDEVETLLSRVDEVETEIAAETKVARAQNALLRNDPDTAFTILSAAADSFASIDPLEPARKRGSYEDLLYQHGLRYPGPALDLAARMNHDALGIAPRDTDASLWARLQNNLGNALADLGTRAGDTEALQAAVTAYRAALEVYTRQASPMDWAMTQNNLGAALGDLGTRAGDTAALRRRHRLPRRAGGPHATGKPDGLGHDPEQPRRRPRRPRHPRGRHPGPPGRRHRLPRRAGGPHARGKPDAMGHDPEQPRQRPPDLGTRAGDTDALQDAVTAFRAALEVRTREASPMHWAGTQNNLGSALRNLGARAGDTAALHGRRHRLPRRAGGLHARGQPDGLGHDPEQPRQRPPEPRHPRGRHRRT